MVASHLKLSKDRMTYITMHICNVQRLQRAPNTLGPLLKGLCRVRWLGWEEHVKGTRQPFPNNTSILDFFRIVFVIINNQGVLVTHLIGIRALKTSMITRHFENWASPL